MGGHPLWRGRASWRGQGFLASRLRVIGIGCSPGPAILSSGPTSWLPVVCPSFRLYLAFQFSYHNFDRSQHADDDIRGCAVLDLASLQWVAMECRTQLDWICKIPRGWMWE